jgi:serine/threonine-protein kinase RsbW
MSESIFLDIKLPNETGYLRLLGKIGEYLAQSLESYPGDREELAYHINLVLTEAMTNVIRHTSDAEPREALRVTLRVENCKLTIKVYDQGQGFELCDLPEPPPPCLAEGGRGLFIIKTLMDRVSYHKYNDGYVLEMEKMLF